jgi:hypothetical protein
VALPHTLHRLYDERGGAAQAVMSTPTGVTHLKFMVDPFVYDAIDRFLTENSNYLLCGGRQSNELLVCCTLANSAVLSCRQVL